MSTAGEDYVKQCLARLNLRAEPFSKRELREGRKAPDFRVFSASELVFFCEVKDLTDVDPLEEHLHEVGPGFSRGCQMGDHEAYFRRAVRKITEAIDQFSSIDPLHEHFWVLAFVNLLDLAAPEILDEILHGSLRDGSGSPYVTVPPHIPAPVQSAKWEIDFYWWLELHDFKPSTRRAIMHADGSAKNVRLRQLFDEGGSKIAI